MAGKKLKWREKPAAKDYEAAASYLRLILPERKVTAVIAGLRRARGIKQQAKNLERACGMKLLPADDPEVADKLKKLKKGEPLSPILLVRGRLLEGVPLVIADGFHRVSAAYLIDQEADIPCRLADLK